MRIAAVILAGGRGERLGSVNKALLDIGGERFIDRAIRVATGCSPILIATGREVFEIPEGAVPVFDLETDYGGPLAGVAAAVAALAYTSIDALLSLAVDSPLIPADFLLRAHALLDTAPAVIGTYGAQVYPTNALWRLDAIADLVETVTAGTAPRSLKRLAEELGAACLDYQPITSADPFRNANTPQDLAFLRSLVASGSRG